MKEIFNLFNKTFSAIVLLVLTTTAYAYEEPEYKIVFESDQLQVRFYEERLVVQTKYANQNGLFQKIS